MQERQDAGPETPNARPKPDYLPTPEEIRAACLRIQSTWSDEERLRREWVARVS